MKVTTTDKQTIFDVAIGKYGDIEGVFLLLQDNENIIDAQGDLQQFEQALTVQDKAIDARVKSEFLSIPSTE